METGGCCIVEVLQAIVHSLPKRNGNITWMGYRLGLGQFTAYLKGMETGTHLHVGVLHHGSQPT